jgi:diguanylate cyclase (GGDEF)-like protein
LFAAFILLAVEYALSRTVHYPSAALLAVITIWVATLAIVVLDPQNRQFVYFFIMGGLAGSLFLSASATAIIFLATFLGVLLLPVVVPGISAENNINALFFILTVGGLVVMATGLRQRYLDQLALQTRQLVESAAHLRELSIRDPLTGLFNRRYLEEVLAAEMIRAARGKYPIGIIMADIDHFKRFNDTHGHSVGDAVLVKVADLLRSRVRASDMACRYGGEEFIVILPEASLKTALDRAELIRAGAGQVRLEYNGRTSEAITISLGVAVFPDHGTNNDMLLGAVDAALYRAKRTGRNRVIAAHR